MNPDHHRMDCDLTKSVSREQCGIYLRGVFPGVANTGDQPNVNPQNAQEKKRKITLQE